jgi:hypothetical protein
MVPLEKVLKQPAPGRDEFAPPRPRPRAAPAPEPPAPRRFKIVEVASGRVLAEDVDARAAIRALGGAANLVDLRVYVWQPKSQRWRLLTLAEQKTLRAHRTIGR